MSVSDANSNFRAIQSDVRATNVNASNDVANAGTALVGNWPGWTNAVASGYYTGAVSVGPLLFKWGTGTSSSDSAQVFSYAETFPNGTIHTTISPTSANIGTNLYANVWTASGFTINRDSAIDVNVPFTYFAVGF